MSNKRIDLTQFEGITPTQWRVDYEAVGDTKTVLYVKSDMTAHDNFVIAVLEDAPNGEYTEADANAIAAVPDLIAELKRYYGFVDELLNYFHHTILENESFMDLMYRMGVFEFEPEPWQNEKGEWMMFVGDTYETGEWVVDKDFKPNQGE